MIFRQLFDSVSAAYQRSLLASRHGGEALILDPVLGKVDRYCRVRCDELDLKLVKADRHASACRPRHRPRRTCATAPIASP